MLSSADQYLIRRDVDLPGLELLLDEEAFAVALGAEFPDVDFRHIRKTYVRYKPATSCVVSYEMMIGETSVLAYGKAVVSLDKLEKYRHRPGLVQDFGIGRTVLEREKIIFSVLPNDNALKRLPKLFDPASQQKRLETLLPDRSDLSQTTFHTLQYKPERRYVAQLRVGEQAQAVIKAYTNNDYQQARINAEAFHSIAPLQIVPELGHSNRDRLLAFSWITGTTLSELIPTASLTWETIEQTGRALAQIHQQDPKHLKLLTRSDEAANLLSLAADLTWLCPQQKQRIQTIAVQLSTALLNAPALYLPIHGDFNAEQVLITSEGITVIDFDRAMRGDPATDLGSFIAKLEQAELRGWLSADRREPLASALVTGYRTAASDLTLTNPITDDRIQLYVAVGLFRLAADPFRYCEPDWLDKISVVLDRIEQRMAHIPFDRFYSSCSA